MDCRCDLADLPSTDRQRPEFIVRRCQRITLDHDADLEPTDPLGLDPAQRVLADEIGVHLKVNQPVKTQLERVCLDVHIGVIGLHAPLDSADR